jgi:hypothetical protein
MTIAEITVDQLDYETLRDLDYSEHAWQLDEAGRLNVRAWTEAGRPEHHGPVCQCCGYAPCVRCLLNPDTCVTVTHTCAC